MKTFIPQQIPPPAMVPLCLQPAFSSFFTLYPPSKLIAFGSLLARGGFKQKNIFHSSLLSCLNPEVNQIKKKP